MTEQLVSIRGIGPLLLGDGRPFGDEDGALAAQTLPLPYPSTIAGFLRTRVGNTAHWDWGKDGPERALAIAVAGPILVRSGKILFPAPADAVIYKSDGSDRPQVMPLRPAALQEGEGCNLPDGLQPLAITEDIKPEPGYVYWPADVLTNWLANPTGDGFPPPGKISGLPRETRVHVAINPDTGTSDDGMLYSTEMLGFNGAEGKGEEQRANIEWRLLARVGAGQNISGVGLLGGEQRLAAVEPSPHPWPPCPRPVQEALAKAKGVRMILATPGIFSGGWKPGWLGADLTGSPPAMPGLRLKLVSAAAPRRQAVSGWDMKARGPKPVRWLAPAGSVYFFEVVEGKATELQGAWLESVCDDPQDQSDGWGLAMWGVWDIKGGGK